MTSRQFWRLLFAGGIAVALGLLAVACGDEGDEEADTVTPTATVTTEATPSPAALGPGAAGIPSNPRTVRGFEGILELDDGLAIWETRPANEDRTGVTEDTIKLGRWSGVSSPALSTYETVWGQTLQAFVRRINEAGGIHGRKLEIITRDDQYNPAVTVQVVKELVENDKVFAMFFGVGDAPHLAVAEYLISKGVPDLWVFDGNVDFVEPVTAKTEFPGLLADMLEGVVTAEAFLKEHPGGKVSVIYQSDLLGQPFMEGFRPSIEEGGGTIVAAIGFDVSAQDMTPFAQQAVDANPDAVVFYGVETPALGTIRALRESIGSSLPIYFRGTVPSPFTSEILDGVAFDAVAKDPYSHPDDPIWPAIRTFTQEEGVINVDILNMLVLREFEMLVRSLEMAGPDLTREGLIEAIETGFDGSWTCASCLGPPILGPQDHWTFEDGHMVRWNHATQETEIVTELTSYETSEGRGIRGNIPGYECQPGTCPWNE